MDPSSAAFEVYQQALAHHNAGRLEEAIAGYRQALALAPMFAEAHCNLGVVQERQGKLQDATESFRRAAELKPEFSHLWFNLGKVLGDLHQLAESVNAYREALRVDPANVPAHVNLAIVLDQLNCPQESLRHHEVAASIRPRDIQVLQNLAFALEKQGRAAEAMDCYERLLQVNPKHAQAHLARAFLRESAAARALLAEGPTPDKLRQVVDDAHSFADRNREYFAVPGLVACKQGCSWCCSFQVTVGAAEVFRIADYVRANLSEDELAKLRARLAEVVQKTAGLNADERPLAGVPCALLVDHACSVYPVRPLVCRGCNSMDAAICEEATRRPEVHIPIDGAQRALHEGTSGGLFSALAEAGWPAEMYDLCSALLIALDHPDAVERWLAKQPVLQPALRKASPSNPGRLSLL